MNDSFDAKAVQKIQAVILAGGFGTRLRPKVADRNKVAADVNGKPFIEYLLNRLAIFGFDEVIICSGYKHDDLHARLGDQYRHLPLIYSKETAPLGTAGALRHALPRFTSDFVVVLNGDSYCDLDYNQMIHHHCNRSSTVTLAGVWVGDASRYGTIVMDSDDKLLEFKEKKQGAGCGFINAGVYVISTELIASLPGGRQISLEKECFPQWAANGHIDVFTSRGPFIDIGTIEAYGRSPSFMSAIQAAK